MKRIFNSVMKVNIAINVVIGIIVGIGLGIWAGIGVFIMVTCWDLYVDCREEGSIPDRLRCAENQRPPLMR